MIIIIRIHSDYEPVTVTTGAWCVNQLAGNIFNIIIIIIIYTLVAVGIHHLDLVRGGRDLSAGGNCRMVMNCKIFLNNKNKLVKKSSEKSSKMCTNFKISTCRK